MPAPLPVVIGVDVGGTNTDAVVISRVEGQGHQILAEDKKLTTSDVTTGVRNAVLSVLRQTREQGREVIVTQINIGTTHFVNAVVQHKNLSRVSVIRLCGTASRALPPFSDFPPSLKDVIFGSTHLVKGGYRVDGREIASVDGEEIKAVVDEIKRVGVNGIVISGLFAPTRKQQEEETGRLVSHLYPEASITLSHTIGNLGLLERENAAILNEALRALCQQTVAGFRHALAEIGTTCPMFLTQNDGTVISQLQALATPVLTFASGPTNSMRGAAYLCQVRDAVVVDVGGTTTDVGVLRSRFPRQAAADVRVAGVRTNFRMPDVHSMGLGGGSYVGKTEDGTPTVGPLSAGFNLMKEALIFGDAASNSDPSSGRRLTATDVAVAGGLMTMGDPSLVSHLDRSDVTATLQRVQQLVEEAIDSVKLSDQPLPVILLGGGSTLVDVAEMAKLKGVSTVQRPEHYGVANAIGAALSQVSASLDHVVTLEHLLDPGVMEQHVQQARRDLPPDAIQEEVDRAVQSAKKPLLDRARDQAVSDLCVQARVSVQQAGADPATVSIVEQEEVLLSYLPGSATRIKVKAVGDLQDPSSASQAAAPPAPWREPPGLSIKASTLTKQTRSATGTSLSPAQSDPNEGVKWAGLTPTRPHVDPVTGEWQLSAWDVECIAVGAGLLGAGGGGSPKIGRVRAHQVLERGQKMRVVSAEKLLSQCDLDQALFVSPAFMGAPVVLYEQLTSDCEVLEAVRCLQELYTVGGYADGQLANREGVEVKEKDGVVFIDNYQPSTASRGPGDREEGAGSAGSLGGRRVVGVVCPEVGGMNSMEPLVVSAYLGLPVVDCDGMGRAFPMLQMFLPFIMGAAPQPSVIADDTGRRAVVLQCATPRQLEDHFRGACMEMGSSVGLALTTVTGRQLLSTTVPRSFSRVWSLGNDVLCARRSKQDPLQTLVTKHNAAVLLLGKVADVSRTTTGAFTRGRVRLEGVVPYSQGAGPETKGAGRQAAVGERLVRLLIDFQNENLVVRAVDEHSNAQETLAVVPDVIIIVDAETAEPIPTEEVRYSQHVGVVVLPAPPPMTTPRALQEVGPASFGYPDVQYVPLGKYVEPTPLAPLQ